MQSTDTFAMNPQFHVEVTAPDTDHKSGLLVVGLMQKDNRKKRREEGIGLNIIGYWIYEVALIFFLLLVHDVLLVKYD